jgi:hypothetical protein
VSGEGAFAPPLQKVADAEDSDIDLVSPNVARIYNAYADGAQNFATDRDFARAAEKVFPAIRHGVQDNRDFLRRSVTHMVVNGVRQFLDLGAGIPMPGGVREIARQGCADARVISVDHEPVSVASNREDFTGDPNALAIWDDLRKPADILRRRDVRGLFDLREPVGVLLVAALHFVAPTDDPARVVARYVREIPAGSYVVISHGSSDAAPPEQREQLAQFVDMYRAARTPLYLRDRDVVAGFFEGLVMVHPAIGAGDAAAAGDGDRVNMASQVEPAGADGVVHLPDWRPDEAWGDRRLSLAHRCAWCGVGRKPPP